MIQLWDETGFQILDTESSVALILGSALIGGDNQAQSGSFTDSRLPLGRPYSLVTSSEVTGFIGYVPTISFSGTTVSWSWPTQSGSYGYPRTRFIYGLR